MHVDDFQFVILRCSAFNVLPVAVCFVSLASIVSELRLINYPIRNSDILKDTGC